VSELQHAAKVELVTLLARFTGPTEAAQLISTKYGVTLDRRTAWKYDASKAGCTAGPKYRQLFVEVRERWLNDLATLPITHQAHRLRTLERLVNKAEARGDYLTALKGLEQAAREVNGFYAARLPPGRAPKAGASPPAGPSADPGTAREELMLKLSSAVARLDGNNCLG
jgi:hypothetical protein